ncbi:hypothetical protein [Streptomyces sp. NPDC002671]
MGMQMPRDRTLAQRMFGIYGAAQVATQPARGPDGVMRIDVTAVPASGAEADGEPELAVHQAAYLRPEPSALTVSGLGVRVDSYRVALSASAVSTPEAGRPAALEVDQLMARLPGCLVVSVYKRNRCLVALRASTPQEVPPHGYQFVLSPEHPDPDAAGVMPLYASAVLGWARWRLEENSRLHQRRCRLDELPPPPDRLILGHAGQDHVLHVSEVERASWPTPLDWQATSWTDATEETRALVREALGKPRDWTPPRPDFPRSRTCGTS